MIQATCVVILQKTWRTEGKTSLTRKISTLLISNLSFGQSIVKNTFTQHVFTVYRAFKSVWALEGQHTLSVNNTVLNAFLMLREVAWLKLLSCSLLTQKCERVYSFIIRLKVKDKHTEYKPHRSAALIFSLHCILKLDLTFGLRFVLLH